MSMKALQDLFAPFNITPIQPQMHVGIDVDHHIHLPPNYSPFKDVASAVNQAHQEGLRLLGTSNYYDYLQYQEFSKLCLDRGIFPALGAEMIAFDPGGKKGPQMYNDPSNPGRCYVCGLTMTEIVDPPYNSYELLSEIRRNDTERISTMIKLVNEEMDRRGVDLGLSEQKLINRLADTYKRPADTIVLQERHLAEAMAIALLARGLGHKSQLAEQVFGRQLDSYDPVTLQNVLRSEFLKAGRPCYVEEHFPSIKRVVDAILEMGGIPCYPVLLDGAKPISEFERDPGRLAKALKQLRIYTIQLIPLRNNTDVGGRFAQLMRYYGVPVSYGTEHNTAKNVSLIPAYRNGPLHADDRKMSWETACIVAAHQVLTLRGEPGFVARDGSRQRSIEELVLIGSSVLNQTRQMARS
jgi:hypothetical protein